MRMDHVAIIPDLHGNIPALEATLKDIKRRHISRIFCLRDIVGKGPHSDKAVDICQDQRDATVKGNWNDFMGRETDRPTILWHPHRLGAERLDYLRQLPNSINFWMSRRRVRLFHASQESVYYRAQRDDSQAKHPEMFTNTKFTGTDTIEPDVVGYGHLHRDVQRQTHSGVKPGTAPTQTGTPLRLAEIVPSHVLASLFGDTHRGDRRGINYPSKKRFTISTGHGALVAT